jgi:hypothetical protein
MSEQMQSALRDVLTEYEELRDATSDYAREMAIGALGIALQELQNAIESLGARAVRAEADTKRLDWLDSGPMSVVPAWGADGSRIGVVAQDGRKDGKTRRAGSVRAAIDAARSQGTRKPKRASDRATP